MFYAMLFYSGQKHVTTHKKTIFECIRWAQNNHGNPHALVLLPETGDDLATIEYRSKKENGRQIWKEVKRT